MPPQHPGNAPAPPPNMQDILARLGTYGNRWEEDVAVKMKLKCPSGVKWMSLHSFCFLLGAPVSGV
jgi:hypothetical protein